MMLSRADQLRAHFAAGDAVRFPYRRDEIEGVVVRTNPKRAVVRVGEEEYTVPYGLLIPITESSRERVERIESVQKRAMNLLKEHGLKRWIFVFDHSTRRAGQCCFSTKTISIAFDLAANGSDTDIRDTLLHEIAHALIGKKHNHGAEWKAKVVEIGGSAERTHRMEFAPARWNVTCENRCWTHVAQQRNSRLICRKCGGKLVYSPRQPL
jgi:predicted SprT family Zn-dependent metalloprotease